MKIRIIGATAVLAVALTACGSGDDDTASANIADSIMDSGNSTFEVTQDQADCVGEGFVDEIGTDQLVEYKILNEDLEAADDGLDAVKMSEDDAQSAADVMQDCADIKEIIMGGMGQDLPEEVATCIDGELTDDVLHDFMVAVFTQDEEAGTEGLTTALAQCMAAGG